MIRIENLVKIYKAKGKRKSKALKDISLTLPNTGMIFVTGKSGSGKSTLVQHLNGLLTPSEDYTSRERFVELEAQYKAFNTYFQEQWKLTKKQIRKEILWAKEKK